jgi:ApbE superfamily uncharacterized protein (UPF0280 family)
MEAQRHLLPDGRWHFQHGPIDIVIGADGDALALKLAHEAAWQRFRGVLQELVAELPTLRRPVMGPCPLQGVIARRMWWACRPFHADFITPMAAVAGAVAQELIAFYQREGVLRAWVNNGGDIALHLAPGSSLRVGLYADLARFDPRTASGAVRTDAEFEVHASLPVRGVATSGWRGRSFSLGIADSVTVLARSAAEADAAATMVANAVNLDDARIVRRPASELKDDSDLGQIPVTVDVPRLDENSVQRALAAGQRRARELQALGLIWSAVLSCQGRFATVDAERQEQLPDDLPRPRAATKLALGDGPLRSGPLGSVFA